MDIEQARFNMIEQQIRTWEVLDAAVLDLLSEVKRERFVPEKYRALAFADLEIPLGYGEVMLAPKLEARILQELRIQKHERVLEIGTGSGYQSALLAHLGKHVVSVELRPELLRFGQDNLRSNAVQNVTLQLGDGAQGWSEGGAFDVIVLTGSVPTVAPAFFDALNPGGRLFAVVGEKPVMRGSVFTAGSGGAPGVRVAFDTVIAPLTHKLQRPQFAF